MIHPTAIVGSAAKIHPSVQVGPFCIIEGHVQIGPGCRLMQGVFVTGWTTIGANCEIHPYAVLGHSPQDVKYQGQRSYCRIGDGCIIREYVSIHRGTVPESETVVGEGCFLLGGAHVGHNCSIGNKVTLINNVLLAGHVTVGDYATVGGGTPVHQFVRIGELAMVAGGGRLAQDVPPFALTDAEGRIAGLNRVGLRRNEFGRDEVVALREAYRILYGKSRSFQDSISELRSREMTPATRKLLDFIQAPSRRGISGRARIRGSPEAEHERE